MPKQLFQGAAEGMPSNEVNEISIDRLFAEWKHIRDADFSMQPEKIWDSQLKRYNQLATLIAGMRAVTAKDLAIQYLVATDEGESKTTDIFEQNARSLAGISCAKSKGESVSTGEIPVEATAGIGVADPLIEVVNDLRPAIAFLRVTYSALGNDQLMQSFGLKYVEQTLEYATDMVRKVQRNANAHVSRIWP